MTCPGLNSIQSPFPSGVDGAALFRRMGRDRKPAALRPHQNRKTGSTCYPPAPIGTRRALDRWGASPHTKLAEDPEGMSHNCGCVYHRHHHGELKISRP